MEEGKRQKTLKSSFTTGAIALVFLLVGFETALFIHKAAVTRLVADRDHPDTVYVVERVGPRVRVDEDAGKQEEETGTDTVLLRKSADHSPDAVSIREKASPRRVETFRFNPNTVSQEDLMRLGFSEKPRRIRSSSEAVFGLKRKDSTRRGEAFSRMRTASGLCSADFRK